VMVQHCPDRIGQGRGERVEVNGDEPHDAPPFSSHSARRSCALESPSSWLSCWQSRTDHPHGHIVARWTRRQGRGRRRSRRGVGRSFTVHAYYAWTIHPSMYSMHELVTR
jgi:hypothetical protein